VGESESGISRLHYFDGYVTFGFIYRDNVKLYRIDTATGKVEISHDYTADENGTFTVNVIPVDGAYLFVRSDGNVYRTGFDEPLEEAVYRFDTERLSGTVISDTVNLSSRFESLTKQYKTAVLVSEDTVGKLTDPDALDLRYLGFVQVAGVQEVKEIYEVLDCLPDEEREKRHNNSIKLGEAIRLFREGRNEEAADILRGIRTSGNSDHVTDKYLDYITDPDHEERAGVFRFVRK